MQNSPLQLERQFISAIHLDANLAAEGTPVVTWQINCSVAVSGHNTDPLRWKVDLAVEFHTPDKSKSPYTGSIKLTGLFAVTDDYPKERVRYLVETNGPSILYGSAREMFANLTARGPLPMVMLPTQSFYNPKPEQSVQKSK